MKTIISMTFVGILYVCAWIYSSKHPTYTYTTVLDKVSGTQTYNIDKRHRDVEYSGIWILFRDSSSSGISNRSEHFRNPYVSRTWKIGQTYKIKNDLNFFWILFFLIYVCVCFGYVTFPKEFK